MKNDYISMFTDFTGLLHKRAGMETNVINSIYCIMDTVHIFLKSVFFEHRFIDSSNIHLGRINATSMLRVMLKIPSVVFLPKCLFNFAVTLRATTGRPYNNNDLSIYESVFIIWRI